MSEAREGDWRRLGGVSRQAMVEPRLQVHWAAQALPAVADVMLEPRDDDTHTNLAWQNHLRALVGQRTDRGLRLGLAVAELALLVLDDDDGIVHKLSLHGHTIPAALAWVAEAMGTDKTLRLRTYRMPPHPVADGGRFTADPGDELDELARWYATAGEILSEIVLGVEGATPVATWPHHFDMGAVILLDPDLPFEKAPQIGLGMSPGDEHYPQPYYYVTPWPLPDAADLPELPGGGFWRRNSFTGAILTAEQILGVRDGVGRMNSVRTFLRTAISAGRTLVER